MAYRHDVRFAMSKFEGFVPGYYARQHVTYHNSGAIVIGAFWIILIVWLVLG